MAQENYFDVDPNAADALNQGMSLGGGIELPFAAPVFWWMNGSAQARPLAQTNPALYYGGWAANEDAIQDVLDDRGIPPIGLVPTDIYTRDGKTIRAFTSRLLVLAPISFRQCWTGKTQAGEQVRFAQYAQGARQHIQVLALTGIQNPDKTYQSWGPVVLSAKGYQASYLQSAMKDWKKLIDRALTQHKVSPKPPAWAFWAGMGTFGEKPESRMVGRDSAQSPITPINLFIPKDITVDLLRRLYVGRAGVSEMAQLLDEASDWLNAWKTASVAGNEVAANGKAAAHGMDEDDYTPPEPGFDDEIPF